MVVFCLADLSLPDAFAPSLSFLQDRMISQLWTDVDRYLAEHLAPHDEVLDAVQAASIAAGLPEISISANQGKMLQILSQTVGAKRILEIGTLGAYSTIWMARGLPEGGKIVTLEADPKHADTARQNLALAKVDDRVELREGLAIESLPKLEKECMAEGGAGPFGFVFIDADKPSIPDYFAWTLRLTRPGSLIVVDNVVRDGAVIDADSDDADVQGVRQLNEVLSKESRVNATVVQTVGAKGYDGFVLAVVK